MRCSAIITVVGLSIAIGGCANDEDGPTTGGQTVSVIMPLEVGNVWRYKVTYRDQGGAITGTTTLRDSVTGKRTDFWGETWYEGQANRADGLWGWLQDTLDQRDTSIRVLLVKFPANVGDEWFVTISHEPYYTSYTMKVLSTSESVTVPAGVFTCYHYGHYEQQVLHSERWFCPNVGEVKSAFLGWGPQAPPVVVQELVSYELN